MAIVGINHAQTKAKHLQTYGIYDRFHRTIQDAFYSMDSRKKLYRNLEELQTDLDLWIQVYHQGRIHLGKYCFGRTPYQPLQESKHLAKIKMFDTLFHEEVGTKISNNIQLAQVVR